jgi:hypothetical protein
VAVLCSRRPPAGHAERPRPAHRRTRGPVINKRVILATAPILYAAAIVGTLFTNTTAFIVVACVGAMLVAALYVGFALSSRKDQSNDQQ